MIIIDIKLPKLMKHW